MECFVSGVAAGSENHAFLSFDAFFHTGLVFVVVGLRGYQRNIFSDLDADRDAFIVKENFIGLSHGCGQ